MVDFSLDVISSQLLICSVNTRLVYSVLFAEKGVNTCLSLNTEEFKDNI